MADDLEALEDDYQTHKVIDEGAEITAEITDLGVDYDKAILIDLRLTNGSTYTASLPANKSAYLDFYSLFNELCPPTADSLRAIEGETITIQFEAGRSKLLIQEGGVGAIFVEESNNARNNSISANVLTELRRLSKAGDRDVFEAPVVDVEKAGSKLAITISLLDQNERFTVDIPTNDFEDTTYQQIVEDVGHGSVKQVEDGILYVRRYHHRSSDESFVHTINGPISNWCIATKKEAVESTPSKIVEDQSDSTTEVEWSEYLQMDDDQMDKVTMDDQKEIVNAPIHAIVTGAVIAILGAMIPASVGMAILFALLGFSPSPLPFTISTVVTAILIVCYFKYIR